MLRAVAHGGKHTADKLQRHALMEQVAHGVDEDQTRLTPAFRQIDEIGMQRDVESVAISVRAHRLQSMRQTLGITVLASSADLRATGHRVPCRLCPFYV